MSQRHKNRMPGCSACRGDYEDPDAAADEDEDSVEETEEAIGE
jgi:hypothetical protein